jgi:two-component system KDP operon response regulator KdpE
VSETAADPATVLIVEDDPALRAALTATLKAAGYRPVPAATAAEGLRWFAHYAPDLVLLDLGLPDRDGLSVIRDIRQRGSTPIVVLSARNAERVKVEALDLGADDYVPKPFGVDELLARLRTGLRHGVQARGSAPAIKVGDLELDLALRTVRKAGEPIRLTPKEYDLLCELALSRGRAVTHAALLRAVWGAERASRQYLRVYIGYLRRKLGAALIESVPGVGYRMRAD